VEFSRKIQKMNMITNMDSCVDRVDVDGCFVIWSTQRYFGIAVLYLQVCFGSRKVSSY
jgi:hypothetical protein